MLYDGTVSIMSRWVFRFSQLFRLKRTGKPNDYMIPFADFVRVMPDCKDFSCHETVSDPARKRRLSSISSDSTREFVIELKDCLAMKRRVTILVELESEKFAIKEHF
uniref:DUF223 domain-containing protein n=1 Tax=Panagrellus redivivus TaxID=6233 RepID=A0A7E4VYQ6_PANRE